MQICPSILEKTAEDIFFQVNKLSPYLNYFQIDIADGIFVPNKTVQIEEIIKHFSSYPLNPTPYPLTFDFHLMVKDYETEIKKLDTLRSFSKGGKKFIKIKYIFIHFSAIEKSRSLDSLRSLGMTEGGTIGITLNPEDQVKDLTSHYPLSTIPFIQIMSVTPGVQGNPFIEETLKKIEQLRNLGYRNKIYLDGAINDKTLPFINEQKYKPDVICPGSFLTKAVGKELEKRVKFLYE